jgi:hypothetical protein
MWTIWTISLLAERMENHHLVDSIQELGVEGPLHLVHDLRAHGLVVGVGLPGWRP